MRVAYVDSSCFIAVSLDEPGSGVLLERLSRFDRLFSSNLLEAELRSALTREGRYGRIRNFITWIRWVLPRRRLTPEIEQILKVGWSKGPDLWHLACALFLRPDVNDPLFFLTLDGKQGEIARSLGFRGL
jgi:hypothetical protein